MEAEFQLLILAAIAISLLHTVTGPDHYLPFIALAKSGRWSVGKTIGWTIICGLGHVLSSVLLGLGGGALGWSFSSMEEVESVRGGLAGWALLAFGLVYFAWGIYRSRKNARHRHFEMNDDGSVAVYRHREGQKIFPQEKKKLTPWLMFLIFLLGPCEPMIPLLFVPAAKASWWSMSLLVLVYTVFTLITMVVMVLVGYFGLSFYQQKTMERYMHALAGMTISICGCMMVFLGW